MVSKASLPYRSASSACKGGEKGFTESYEDLMVALMKAA